MPQQDAKKRIKNFNEVALGYTEELALKEAVRCLGCKNPQCVKGCPVNVDIPGFITKIKEKDYDSAIKIIKKTNNLPAVCGRVCPQEEQCEAKCILGIKAEPVSVGRLERFAADYEKETKPEKIKLNGKKVAVVGSGPASLTCAADLAKLGYTVVLYEALHKAGGVLVYGIPEFRLPKAIVQKEVDFIKSLGVDIRLNHLVGRIITIKELSEQYDAVFIGTGAGLPYFMGLPGENLPGVYSANEFLTRINLMKAYKFPDYITPIKKAKKVVVVGGGNVAMDSARCAKRLGADVTLVYRRSEKEMPARNEEIEHAKEEGINFKLLTNPVGVLGQDKVEAVECIKMELGEPDDSGRRRPIPIKGSEFKIKADQFIVAIGQGPNPLIAKTTPELKIGKKGNIEVDENGKSNLKNVFAGGDIVGGNATVIKAMGEGKRAAWAIHANLKG